MAVSPSTYLAFAALQDRFERNRGDVVALIDDDLAVVLDLLAGRALSVTATA